MPPVGFEPTISAGDRPQAKSKYTIMNFTHKVVKVVVVVVVVVVVLVVIVAVILVVLVTVVVVVVVIVACGRSPAEIVGSNPTGGMDICLL